MEPKTSEERARVRLAIRLLALGIACEFAVAIAGGVLYDPHAKPTTMVYNMAAAGMTLGIVSLLVGLVSVAVVHVRGGEIPPRDRTHR